jgi:hypothetical protein
MSDRPRTPFADTEALLACLDGDEGAALAIIGDLLPFERRTLADAVDRLAEYVEPRNWCPGCHSYVPAARATVSHGLFRWHRGCLKEAAATGEF